LIVPVIVQPLLVIEVNLEPTSPLMVEPVPLVVQVTVPAVGTEFVPRTV
jgi:hypothetical protein